MPNLAVAAELRSSDSKAKLLYVGSRAALDRDLVSEAKIPFRSIFTGKLRRYFSWQNFVDPFFVLIGFFQSFWIVARFWPDAVFTKGGFVSLPVAFAAFILRRPLILHESDRSMGLSNRIVAVLATHVCVGFPDVIQNSYKTVFTGNPIRSSILHGSSKKGYEVTGFRPEKPVLLVWGGSQGAQEINAMVEVSFEKLKSDFQVVHITGSGKTTNIKDPNYIQFEYIGEELKHIYAITNLVAGRAGANSLYELALMQKPNILIPLQSAAHNHQQLNAEYFEQMGASVILRYQPLHEVVNSLWSNPTQMEAMEESLAKVSKPHANRDIAKLILEVGH